MRPKFTVTVLLFFLLWLPSPVNAYIDPPILETQNPTAGQPVFISVAAGGCDAIPADPSPTVTRFGMSLKMVLPIVHSYFDDFCVAPDNTYFLGVGSFSPGTYDLEVDATYPGFDGAPQVTQLLGIVRFTVATFDRAPLLGPCELALLGFLLVALALCALSRTGSGCAMLLMVLHFGLARAQTPTKQLEVLISARSGAPNADDIVAYFSSSTGKPPGELVGQIPLTRNSLHPQRAQAVCSDRGDTLRRIMASLYVC